MTPLGTPHFRVYCVDCPTQAYATLAEFNAARWADCAACRGMICPACADRWGAHIFCRPLSEAPLLPRASADSPIARVRHW